MENVNILELAITASAIVYSMALGFLIGVIVGKIARNVKA